MKNEGFNIYVIKNDVNEKLYVGQTTYGVKQRFSNHISSSRNVKTALYGAFKKYGVESFKIFKVIKLDNKEEMDEMEMFLIDELNTIYPHGYNMTKGGEGSIGRIVKDETKLKISQSTSGKRSGCDNPFFGKKHSESTKEKISLIKKNSGIKISEENKKKTSECFSKKVINYKTGEMYDSVKIFSRELKLSYDVSKKRLHGRYSSPEWFTYKYLDDYIGVK